MITKNDVARQMLGLECAPYLVGWADPGPGTDTTARLISMCDAIIAYGGADPLGHLAEAQAAATAMKTKLGG